MKTIKDMDIGELAAYICNYLNSNGLSCVLSGGACVSIYSKNKYQSGDLDFIYQSYSSRKRIKNLLETIDFIE